MYTHQITSCTKDIKNINDCLVLLVTTICALSVEFHMQHLRYIIWCRPQQTWYFPWIITPMEITTPTWDWCLHCYPICSWIPAGHWCLASLNNTAWPLAGLWTCSQLATSADWPPGGGTVISIHFKLLFNIDICPINQYNKIFFDITSNQRPYPIYSVEPGVPSELKTNL